MLRFNPFTKKLDYTNDADVSALTADVSLLKNNEYKITYYEIVSGTSGSITIPTGATINENEFGQSGNSVLSEVDGNNKPTYQSPKDVFGNPVTANLLTDGSWVLSGTPTSANVAIIFSLKIKAIDYQNLDYDFIIETVELNDWTLGYPTYDARYTQIGIDGQNYEPVISILNTPPAHVEGERYLIGTIPTGDWVGRANQIAESNGVSWTYTIPSVDYKVFVSSTLITYKFNGTIWLQSTGTPILQSGNTLGVTMRIGSLDSTNVELIRGNSAIARVTNNGMVLLGNPTAPNQAANTNNTRIANTAYVDNAVSNTNLTRESFLLGGM